MFTLRIFSGIEREREKEKCSVEKRWRPWGLRLVLWGAEIEVEARDRGLN